MNYTLIISSVNLFFTIFGTLGNLLTFLILVRKNLRNNSYIKYLAALCLIDICCLYTWNFSLIYQDLLSASGKRIEFESAFICRLFSFISYYTLQSSSWIMCAIGIDRVYCLLVVTNHQQRSTISSRLNPFKNPLVTIFGILAFLFCLNFIVLIYNAEPYLAGDGARSYSCYAPEKFFQVWDIVHLIMYSLLPFLVILIENIIIICVTMRHSKQMKKYQMYSKTKSDPCRSTDLIGASPNSEATQVANKQKKQSPRVLTINKSAFVTNLLLFLTISFVCTTLPYSMYYATKANEMSTRAMYIVKRSLGLLQYLRHSTNFIIYVISSSIIRNEITSANEEFKRFLRFK